MRDVSVNRYRQNHHAAKVLGAVYTPPRVAEALVRWAVRSPVDRVLDPACGDGVFLAAARKRLAELGCEQPIPVGIDIDPQAAQAAGAICGDFFEWAQSTASPPAFDAIVGNPPFIRSHLFPESSRRPAFQEMRQMGLRPSRLMSTWAPFVAIGCKLLTPNGRLAFVVPEELLHVGYAGELRRFLLKCFRRVIVCLPERNLFPAVQQSVVLLLCDQEQDGPGGLLSMDFTSLENGPPYAVTPAPEWDWCPKWTHLFLSPGERQTVDASFRQLGWKPFREYGRVEVGVVTGSNDFFILSGRETEALGNGPYWVPIVTGARDLPGINFSDDDFLRLVQQGRPAFLLSTAEPLERLPPRLRDYLHDGIRRQVHLRFKCRNREPWYAVPGVFPADALLLRQAGEMPRLIHLEKKCVSTDTVHRVRWRRPELGRRYAVGFLNTWTLLACELTGRSYGGGVLELMPGEANAIPLPPPLEEFEALFKRVDELVRSHRFDTAVEMVDRVVKPTDITAAQYDAVRNIWASLVRRRRIKQDGNH